jgi:hypothetical protein
MCKTRNPSPISNKLPLTVGFILFCSLPEMIIWLTQPEGMVFVGTVVNIDDLNVYLSAIRQGSVGNWLFAPQFSTETIPPHLAYFPYILTGKLSSILGGSSLLWYQILRISAVIFVVWSLTNLLEVTFPDSPDLQCKAIKFLLLSSGFGWLVLIISGTTSQFTPDLTTPEWNLVTSFLSAPHFLLGIGFQGLVIKSAISITHSNHRTNLIQLFLSGLGLGLVYPFLIPVNGLIFCLLIILKIIQAKKIQWSLIFSLGAGSIPMLLFLAYYGIFLPQDPIYQQSLLNNNLIPPPIPLGLIAGFGLLFIFAMAGLPQWIKLRQPVIIPLWIVANLINLYLPFSFSGRFILAFFVPVTVMAVFGMKEVVLPIIQTDKNQDGKRSPFYAKIFFILMVPSNIFILIFAFQAAQNTPDFPYYYIEDEKRALEWLAQNSTGEDVLLADYPISSLAPRYFPGRVFLGHLNLTINLEEKRDMLIEYWDPETTAKQRDAFLNRWGISLIYQGRYENALTQEIVSPPGTIIYQENEITIYAVQP